MLLARRPTARLGTLAVVAAIVWFAPVWVGWEDGPPALRSLGLVLAPLLPAIVLEGALLIPPARGGLGRIALQTLVALAAGATLLASIVLVLVREPIRELHCWSDCTANAFVVHDDLLLTERAMTAVLALGVACGVLAALIAVVRLARAAAVTRRSSGPALAAAALAGLALAGYAATLRLAPPEAPDRPLLQWLFAARALALVLLGAGLAWLAVRPVLVRGHVTRLAVDLEAWAAAGGLAGVLARALGDPGLRLGYPVGAAGQVVDADGQTLVRAPGRELTPIVGDGDVVALVESRGQTVDELERELGPAAHLALENERLRAEAIARLADVTASRARIVETADRARRRMERDLHDGAQQRMLALGYDLRVALTLAEMDRERRGGGRVARRARSFPRRLARAARHRARHLPRGADGLGPRGRARGTRGSPAAPPRGQPAAASGATRRRWRRPPTRSSLRRSMRRTAPSSRPFRSEEGAVHVSVEGEWNAGLLHVEDRVRAAGGELSLDGGRLDAVLPSA